MVEMGGGGGMVEMGGEVAWWRWEGRGGMVEMGGGGGMVEMGGEVGWWRWEGRWDGGDGRGGGMVALYTHQALLVIHGDALQIWPGRYPW